MPLTEEQQEWLTLALVPGIGTAYFVRLLARFRTPRRVFEAPRRELEELIGRKLTTRLQEYTETNDLRAQERKMDDCGATLLTLNDSDYPLRLAEIYDPPLVLFQRGRLIDADTHCVAIVGTRRATPYGLRMAERMAQDLATRGITVVSGLASGIDTAAHRGAIKAGGRTVAILGCGVDVVYPEENRDLLDAVIDNGAVLSQFAMGMKPLRGNFPIRNRIISGMTLGTIVIQAPEKSGALITAHSAVEQGREVFAVPGEVGNRNSEGPHRLIREGAKLVENVDDILVELNLDSLEASPNPPTESTAPEPVRPAVSTAPPLSANVSESEKSILSSLKADGSFIDEIALRCQVPVSEALSTLTLLELKGMVQQFSGKRFAPR